MKDYPMDRVSSKTTMLSIYSLVCTLGSLKIAILEVGIPKNRFVKVALILFICRLIPNLEINQFNPMIQFQKAGKSVCLKKKTVSDLNSNNKKIVGGGQLLILFHF